MTAKLMQRMPAELHGRLKELALENKMSVNTLVNQICELYFTKGEKTSPVERRLADLESRVGALELTGMGTFSSTKAPGSGAVAAGGASVDPAVVPRSGQQSVSAFTW